jgi:hypothetical protein
MKEVSVITATGDRPEAFKLCDEYMNRQTYKRHIRWIVVNDGFVEVEPKADVAVVYIRRGKIPGERPGMSVALNLLEAIKHVDTEIFAFMEDDDWYSHDYIEQIVNWLEGYDIAGEAPSVYYHIVKRRWMLMSNRSHASLCQTGVKKHLLPEFHKIVTTHPRGIDMRLWKRGVWKKNLILHPGIESERKCIGIKGMPGRNGMGVGHIPEHRLYNDDPAGKRLTQLIGQDADKYFKYYEGRDNHSHIV